MANKFGISKNVLVMGLVSFFNDFASEMIYPIVPIFLTTVLGAPVAVVGVIEGIAESTASFLKVISGWLSDKLQKRKSFAVAGYCLSTISKVVIGLAFGWPLVLFGRFLDRFGKGVRTSARDALIVESSTAQNRGRSLGFHRALDTLGAVVGPLAAILLLYFLGNNLRPIFFIAFVPGLIGVVLLLLFVKDVNKVKTARPAVKFGWKNLDGNFKIFLFVSVIFAIGNSSDAFLILRAQSFGLPLALTILAYVLFNITYSLFSEPAGALSDKIGPKKILLSGFFLFSLVYLAFGLINSSIFIWLLFPIYGIYMAMTDGVGKAYIADLVPQEKLGTAFGLYQTAVGICTLFSSIIAGLLWTYAGVGAPFIFGSAMALIAVVLFFFSGKEKINA